jgi:ABC-type bacteriocin/lantibiotic exporter with double-glycine peptidase domain
LKRHADLSFAAPFMSFTLIPLFSVLSFYVFFPLPTTSHSFDCRYGKSIQASYEQGKLLALTQGGFAGVVGLLGYAAILCVLWYGGMLVCRNELTTGRLTSFMLYSVSVAVAFGIIFR